MRTTPHKHPGQGKGRRTMDGEILDISSASKVYGPPEKMLRSRIAKGSIPYRRWGGRIIFLRRELDQFFSKTLPGVSISQALENEKAHRPDMG